MYKKEAIMMRNSMGFKYRENPLVESHRLRESPRGSPRITAFDSLCPTFDGSRGFEVIDTSRFCDTDNIMVIDQYCPRHKKVYSKEEALGMIVSAIRRHILRKNSDLQLRSVQN
jgi:hypothetical protein